MKRSILQTVFWFFSLTWGYGQDASLSHWVIEQYNKSFPTECCQHNQYEHPRCLTPLLITAEQQKDQLDTEANKLMSGLMDRPSLIGNELVATIGIFAFHYTLDGPDDERIDPTDSDMSGFPDYLEFMALTLNSVAAFYHNNNDYTLPPYDGDDYDGSYYDVYISAREAGQGIYGYVAPDTEIGDNPNSSQIETKASTSFMVMRSNYDGFPGTTESNVQVTLAHEYLHSIQFGYWNNQELFLFEGTAAWAEDLLFPGIDDNFQYLSGAFQLSDVALNLAPGEIPQLDGHWYSSWLFFRHMTEHTSNDLIRSIFDQGIEYGSIEAIDEALLDGHDLEFFEAYENYLVALPLLTDNMDLSPYDFSRAMDYQMGANGGVAFESAPAFIGDPIFFNSIINGNETLQRIGADYHLIQSNQDFRVDAGFDRDVDEVGGVVLLKVVLNQGEVEDMQLQGFDYDDIEEAYFTEVTDSDLYDAFVLIFGRVDVASEDLESIQYEYLISPMDATSVDDQEQGGLALSPNPTQGKVNISGLSPGNQLSYTISGADGRIYTQKSILDRPEISLENVQNGVYFINIIDNKTGLIIHSEKIIKYGF